VPGYSGLGSGRYSPLTPPDPVVTVLIMIRRCLGLFLVLFCVVGVPFRSPAPLIYRPGEGWTYEPVGGEGKWRLTRAKDQMEAAQAAFDKKAYDLSLKAAKRTVSVWPLSDYAPQAQYLVGRSYEALGKSEQAFNAYQTLLEKFPKIPNYEEVLGRQFQIAKVYYAGKWFKLWRTIPLPPWLAGQMDRTATMFEKIVKNGAYSAVAPQAQMNIAAAREKQANYRDAVRAYQVAADRYFDQPQVASDALYSVGKVFQKQASTAEYDQSAAGQAIAAFTDFLALYPLDSRATEAQQSIGVLRTEQARGSYMNAQYYEHRRRWIGALVYYNEVTIQDPNCSFANAARQRIDAIKKLVEATGN
jgi:outer membrane protein assembly factor BamD (BamD/ComL family)